MVVTSVNLAVCKAGRASHLRGGALPSVRPCGVQRGIMGVNSRRRNGVTVQAGLEVVAAGLVEAIGHHGLVLVRLDTRLCSFRGDLLDRLDGGLVYL